MKILFMGTPQEAADILEQLLREKHQVVAVITQPDRPRGRGRKLAFSPVKEIALKYALPLEQPEKVKGNQLLTALIKSWKPDIIVIVAYGKILPGQIINIPKYGCLNVHASLLPKYRGAAPIQWALLNGEKETGVTIMRLNELLDSGEIILQEGVTISEDDNALTLSRKVFAAGSRQLLAALRQVETGKASYLPQDEAAATFAPAITRENGEIDWRKTARQIHNRIRALLPWPVAHTFFREKLLKIWRSQLQVIDFETKYQLPGTIVAIVKNSGFIVASGEGHLLIREVQPAGKKCMPAYNFVIGHDVEIGETLPN